MIKKNNLIYLFLLISVIFLLIGTYLTVNAYLGMHSIEVASSQLEFVKNLPFCIDIGKNKKIPLYKENHFMKKYNFIKGCISADNYDNKPSIRQVGVALQHPVFFETKLICLIDARSRN